MRATARRVNRPYRTQRRYANSMSQVSHYMLARQIARAERALRAHGPVMARRGRPLFRRGGGRG